MPVEARLDRLEARFDQMMTILIDIRATLKDLDRRVTVLEQRSFPIMHG